jgi:hypothetical protein
MSQEVNVNRRISFIGDADQEANIRGHISPEKLFTEYNFTELALDGTNKYTMYLDTTSTVASGAGGALLTSAATDTKTCSISCGGVFWYPANSPTCEWKFKIDVITTVAIFVGFNDAVSEGSGALPFLINGTTIGDTATDGAGFCFDTTQTTDYWYIVNTKNGTQGGTLLAATYVPVAATQVTLRVSIDTSGNAYYYYNGVQVGSKASAVTSTIPLVPFIGIRNNSGTAHILTARYCRVWGNTI